MFIVKNKKIFVLLSTVLVAVSIILISVFGLKVSIDFKGGALTEVAYDTIRPDQETLSENLKVLELGSVLIQPTGDMGYIVKSRDLSDTEHTALLKVLSLDGANSLKEVNFNSIGPSVGRELTRKAIIAVILVSLAIIFFIAYAFRKVSSAGRQGVASWQYGLIAIVTLLHDVIISVGLFALLSHYYGAELDTLFVVAVLTVLGLSVSDTIVIFDRIRENLSKESKIDKTNFSQIIGDSLNQSFARSIATSLTVILALLALVFFGPTSTKYFAIMLTAGMFFGTYSSIFLASPMLVLVHERQMKK
ncbi:MAG: protein translocase subunit SecF [Candidatus Pacebacteria bacterium]|jgi:preprotein translocase subunit SecF|nr:protein translocase subunit SecF [Candidatus Paceibacterota bacterium]